MGVGLQLHFQTRKVQSAAHPDHIEGGGDQRSAAAVAWQLEFLDQSPVGIILVFKRAQERGPELSQIVNERGPRFESAPQRQEVNAMADQFLIAFVEPLSRRDTNHDFFLAGQPVQQYIIGGQECLKERAFLPRTDSA